MKRIMAVALLWAATFVLHAEIQPPAPSTVNIERTFDRMSPPSGDISIWLQESGGYDTDEPSKWGRNSWVCESSSDPKHGECNTKSKWGGNGQTTLPLLFTEKRSGMRVILNLIGYNQTHQRANSCGSSSFSPAQYQVYTATYVTCTGGGGNAEAGLTVYIPATELAKLPVGGLWQADLHLKLMEWDPYQFLADFNAHIDLNVIDPGHIDIYFPDFSSAAPLVELDLRPHGAPDESPFAQDITTLDMCLYDGYNANSTRYEVLLKDEGSLPSGRATGDFSIYRDGGEKGPLRDRIDYHVQLMDPETRSLRKVNNNETIVWTQINQNLIRPVRLPAITYPVLCVPAPLVLSVDKFYVKDKNAGHYRGVLTVIFTPTTPTVD
ncbi:MULTISPECIES: CfaE/CblD family pilus tip adhesin [Enterobacterales]|uniref:CfaE/CblD family pilus tip adhesin n=1 Tax=Enterobacterales TaxID=91347 RepID=UPI002ED80F7C